MDQLRLRNIVKNFTKNLSLLITESSLYPTEHPNIIAQIKQSSVALEEVFSTVEIIYIDIVEKQFVFEGIPLYELRHLAEKTILLLESRQIRCLCFKRGVTPQELSFFCRTLIDKARQLDAEAMQKELAQAGISNILVEKKRKESAETSALPAPDKIYGGSLEANKLVYNAVAEGKILPLDVIDKVAQNITDMIIKDSASSLATISLRNYDEYTFTHSSNVAVLSVALASNIIDDQLLLKQLAKAALLHDIGKIKIPREILNKPGKLNAEEWQIMQRHPLLGVKVMEQQDSIDLLAVTIAAQHHMKYDLSGYPVFDGLEQPHPLSLLVTICDVYDAITSKRPYKPALSPDKAIALMMRLIGCDFDPHFFKIFTHMVGIYPPGSFVRLNTGEIAVSRKVLPHALLLPEVKIIFDQNNNRLKIPVIVDLSDEEMNPDKRCVDKIIDPLSLGIDIASVI